MTKLTSRELVAHFYPSHEMHSPAERPSEAITRRGWTCEFRCSCEMRLILTQRMLDMEGIDTETARTAMRLVPPQRSA